MILTLIPALMGSRATAAAPEAQAPAHAPTRPADGPGFAALFLALLGGSATPTSDGVAPGRRGAVLDAGSASPLSHAADGASTTSTDQTAKGGATVATGPVARSEGRAATEVEGEPFRPSMAVPEGRTTTAGWAALAGAGGPTVAEPAADGEAMAAKAVEAGAVTAKIPSAGPMVKAPVAGPVEETSVPVEKTSVADPMAGRPSTGSVETTVIAEPAEKIPTGETVEDVRLAPPVDDTASVEGAVDANVAVSSAAGAVAAAPTRVADVRTADRALEKLDPELRAKVERVIERMASEHGHKVEVVEGYRSAERQRYLYAQGRTSPGPVVTWTKESLHLDGHAADLKVEGPWAQRDAYVHLQRIAKEEGLGTLGMKDPGHVELLQDGTTRAASLGQRFAAEGGRAPGAGEPMVASSVRVDAVARPARVARVASVARTAHVAAPGTSRMTTPEERVAQVAAPPRAVTPRGEEPALRANVPNEPTPRAAEPRVAASAPAVTPVSAKGPTPVGATPAGEGVDRVSTSPRDRRDAARRETSAEPVVGGGSGAAYDRGPSAPVAGVGAVTGADPLAQMDRIEAVREAMASTNPSRVTVRLDGTAGPVDRVQVELLDQALRGQVDVGDADLAAQLRGDVGSLMRTLEEKGYDPQALAVKLTANAADATRDGMAGWLRTDSAAQALRTILGAQAGSAGRDAHDRSQGEAHQGRHDPHGTNQQSRRDNRRDGR